jgi:hypothetical protein
MTKDLTNKYVFFAIIITVFSSLSCKKRLFDYRNKYVGTYRFSYVIIDCPRSYPPRCDTLKGDYVGKISYERTTTKGFIYIESYSGGKQMYGINKEGIFIDCAATGKFEGTDKLSFIWETKMACGGGHGIGSYTVTGVRQ